MDAESKVMVYRTSVAGWMAVKEFLRPMAHDGRPGLLLSPDCRCLRRNLALIQHDEENPCDCATQPHDITHINDALRYFCVSRTLRPNDLAQPRPSERLDVTGGEVCESYLSYGGV